MYYANYHTHTPRCHHAFGSESEMAEAAIKNGISVLGFADHSPQIFENGMVSGMRMLPEETPGYVKAVRKVAEEYKDKLRVYVGFEAEYFPRIFKGLYGLCRDNDVDYLILGQHFLPYPDGKTFEYVGNGTPIHTLKCYVDTLIEAMQTGCFTYIAHPDIYSAASIEEGKFEKEYGRLLSAAADMDIPLEMNKLGYCEGRGYPSKRFFSLAKKYGNKVIMGVDAHCPGHFARADLDRCYAFAKSLGLNMIDEPELRHPWKN